MTASIDPDAGPALTFRLQATVAQLETDMKNARKAMDREVKRMEKRAGDLDTRLSNVGKNFGKKIGRVGAAAGGGVLAGLGAGASLREVESIARELDAVAKQARSIGFSPSFLQALQLIGEKENVGRDATAKAFQNFAKNMADAAQGLGEAKAIVEGSGLVITTADGQLRKTSDLVMEFADAIAAMDSPAERLQAVGRVFGEEGRGLVSVLGQGSQALRTMITDVTDTGKVLDESLFVNAEKTVGALDNLQQKVDATSARAADKLQPVLIKIRERLAELQEQLYSTARAFSDFVGFTEADVTDMSLIGAVDAFNSVRRRRDDARANVDRLRGEGRLGGAEGRDAQARLERSERALEAAQAEVERQRSALSASGRGRAGRNPSVGNLGALQTAAEGNQEVTRTAEEMESASVRALEAIAARVTPLIGQIGDLDDALKRAALSIAELAVQGLFGQGQAGGFFNNLFGVASNGLLGLLGFANGGVIQNGVERFASGGVVSRPTLFPMRGRMGLMGEAGPEAILPLAKGPGGKLGVRAQGGGSTSFTFAPVLNIAGDVTEATTQIIDERLRESEARMAAAVPALAADGARRGGSVSRTIRGQR